MRLDDIAVTTLRGEDTTLASVAGPVTLVVNVASKCGFTPQYAALQRLHETYGPRGLTVLGFPSDQFRQELDDAAAIEEFCSVTYGVSFPMFATVRVDGDDRHPLFGRLAEVPDADGEAGPVRWNFEKFLVTPDGAVRFRSAVEPDAPQLVAAIEAALA